ncbi:hypothetical protein ACRAWF_21280 [Streptomyces sp. L7]
MGVFMQAPGDDDQHTMLLCHRPDRAGVNHHRPTRSPASTTSSRAATT